MAKVLKVRFPEECNGCELCVMEVQRQLGKVGLEGSPIRIFRNGNEFSVVIDPLAATLDITQLNKVCPKANFYFEEDSEGEFSS